MLLAISSGLVELLPIEAWLLVLVGYDGYPPDQAAAPFWYLCLVMALAWIIGRRAQGYTSRRTIIISLLPLLAFYLILLRISPSEFGAFGTSPLDFSWAGTEAPAFFSRPGRPTALVTLLLLLAFLWWRGMTLASHRATTASALRRFGVYMALLLLAALSLGAVPPEVRALYSAALTLILIGEVFCGLLSAAMARLAEQRTARRDPQSETNDAHWVGSAILVALGIVALALFVSLIFDFQSFLALLGYLGPVGIAIGSALTWVENLLLQGLSQLLRLIFAPLASIHLTRHTLRPLPQLSYQCVTRLINGKRVVQCGQRQAQPSAISGLAHVELLILIAMILALTGVILYIAVRKAFSFRHASRDPQSADEREALDARIMLAEQMRGLLDRFAHRHQSERDPLQPGTVRYLYRDVLRSAGSHGLERIPAETPDEYARRLASTAPLVAYSGGETEDLLILSEAYNDARYAEREPDTPTRQSLRDRAGRLIRRFGD